MFASNPPLAAITALAVTRRVPSGVSTMTAVQVPPLASPLEPLTHASYLTVIPARCAVR